MASIASGSAWHDLPAELKQSIVEVLDEEDARALSFADNIPTHSFVKLDTQFALEQFLLNVPGERMHHIHTLDVSPMHDDDAFTIPLAAPYTDSLGKLLLQCPRLETLTLRAAGCLSKDIIPCFSDLVELRHLTLNNVRNDARAPLSERVVVSIAATIPNLQYLELDTVTRSRQHAPELVGAWPYVPVVTGDDDVPSHRMLDLSAPADCAPTTGDVERIMAVVGPTVAEFSLNTAVNEPKFADKDTPLRRLRRLHIAPAFPVESVVDTVAGLAGSPIEDLSLRCHEDDVIDVCEALHDFLSMRASRGPGFYDNLRRIDVSVAPCEDDAAAAADEDEVRERVEATEKLQMFCRELRLEAMVAKIDVGKGRKDRRGRARSATTFSIVDPAAYARRRMSV
ncbi:hypothetical protein BD626DRAFT_522519 [Schizophyllum amplum]|uniref:F-box domain-containing protein n=1 Tax=Schizophyllum amplum TaxID=97359 RepID=A0A550BTE3_9AGAR|nr:hypothetical protein BD626DRAFT_522519 [Auriculariopsis ampla]